MRERKIEKRRFDVAFQVTIYWNIFKVVWLEILLGGGSVASSVGVEARIA